MLVLSRKQLERICIGDSVTITVIAILGNRVRLGIDAPKEIGIVRSELHEQWIELSPMPLSHPQ